MQNKANLRKRQMSVKRYSEKGYENLGVWRLGKNKANQSQLKPKPMSRWVSHISRSGDRPPLWWGQTYPCQGESGLLVFV
jgi:hypothetical protein